MESLAYRDCPGCGLRLPISDAIDDPRFFASPECQRIHAELTGYTVMRGDPGFMHQHLVDAYAAQHANDSQPPITVAFALVGLYLTFEQGATGKQAQRMHMLLAQRSKQWPRFPRPAHTGALTVQDVIIAPPGPQRDEALLRWARSVWDAWAHEREAVKQMIDKVMGN
ncbi:MAG TPA: DUF5946 family protein [Ktedonobacterales bacterium]